MSRYAVWGPVKPVYSMFVKFTGQPRANLWGLINGKEGELKYDASVKGHKRYSIASHPTEKVARRFVQVLKVFETLGTKYLLNKFGKAQTQEYRKYLKWNTARINELCNALLPLQNSDYYRVNAAKMQKDTMYLLQYSNPAIISDVIFARDVMELYNKSIGAGVSATPVQDLNYLIRSFQ